MTADTIESLGRVISMVGEEELVVKVPQPVTDGSKFSNTLASDPLALSVMSVIAISVAALIGI